MYNIFGPRVPDYCAVQSLFKLVVSHIQGMYGHTYNKSMDQPGKVANPAHLYTQAGIGCQPEKLLYTVPNPASGLLNREKNKNKMSGSAPPPPPPRCSFGENKIKITRRISMPRRYAGLGPSCVCTRIPSTRCVGRWVSLLKTILDFRVR